MLIWRIGNEECFKTENLLDTKLYMSVILTNPKNIQEMNKNFLTLGILPRKYEYQNEKYNK